MSDDTPTERLAEATEELAEERTKSRTLMIVLIAVGILVLIGLVVVVVLLLTRPADGGEAAPTPTTTETSSPAPSDSPTPTESATPTVTPTPTATAAPPPPPPADNSPTFSSFTQGQTVSCNITNPPGYTTPVISFSYQTKNASSVWFLFGEGDAADVAAFPMPLNGNQGDVYGGGSQIDYPCGQAQQKYTLTIVGTNGQHVSKTFTVRNNGDVY